MKPYKILNEAGLTLRLFAYDLHELSQIVKTSVPNFPNFKVGT